MSGNIWVIAIEKNSLKNVVWDGLFMYLRDGNGLG